MVLATGVNEVISFEIEIQSPAGLAPVHLALVGVVGSSWSRRKRGSFHLPLVMRMPLWFLKWS